MSVVQSIKQTLGIAEEGHTYRCNECGEEFQTETSPNSSWLQCPECESDDVELIERAE